MCLRSEAQNALFRLNNGIMGSNLIRSMDVRLSSMLLLSCKYGGLVTFLSLVQRVVSIVCMIHSFQIESEMRIDWRAYPSTDKA
jgi:hypothetical protein